MAPGPAKGGDKLVDHGPFLVVAVALVPGPVS
jgi:hypothetical protein